MPNPILIIQAPTRWDSGIWEPIHGQIHVAADLLVGAIFLALTLICVTILRKENVSFRRTISWFTFTTLAASLFFMTEVMTFYYPWHWAPTIAAVLMAFFGVGLAVSLYKEVPNIVSWVSPKELETSILDKTAELERSNELLASSQKQFEALVEANPDAIARIDSDLKHVYVNSAANKASGLPTDYFIGKKVEELNLPKEFLDRYVFRLREVLKTGKAIKWEPVESQSLEDITEAYVMSLVPMLNDEGKVTDILSITRDITERKRNELRLKMQLADLHELSKSLTEKNRQMEDFAHIVSHNLRSPVRNLKMLLEFYSMEKTEEGKQELVNKLRDVSQQLTLTLQDLTEIINSRPSEKLEGEDIQLAELCQGLMDSITMQIREAKAEITHDFSQLSQVNYPKVYLESALLNLLTNALKYAHPERKAQIHITAWKEYGKPHISVEDNGLGIDLNLHGDRLFGLHNTFHDHEDARGMGLFITKNQIEALGGDILVESTVNEGSKFTLVLGHRILLTPKERK